MIAYQSRTKKIHRNVELSESGRVWVCKDCGEKLGSTLERLTDSQVTEKINYDKASYCR